MVQEPDIKAHIARYVAGECSLAALERWLNSANVPLIADPSDRAFLLVAKLDSLIGEYQDHAIAKEEFRDELVQLLNDIVLKTAPVDRPAWIGRFTAHPHDQWVLVSQPAAA